MLALLAATATAASKDPLYQFQGWIFTLAFTIGSFVLAAGIASGKLNNPQDRYSDGVIRAGDDFVELPAVGGLTPGSGDFPAAGVRAGVVAAARSGYDISFTVADTTSNPGAVLPAAQKLVTQDHALAVVKHRGRLTTDSLLRIDLAFLANAVRDCIATRGHTNGAAVHPSQRAVALENL